MAYFENIRASGIAPGVAPRLLAEQFGKTAHSTPSQVSAFQQTERQRTLQSGNRPLDLLLSGYKLARVAQRGRLAFVPGPICRNDTNERLYYTGDDYPRVGTVFLITGSSGYPAVSYRLGVPAPSAAPSIAKWHRCS